MASGNVIAVSAGYIISQLVAGIAAAFLLRAVLGGVATSLGRPELAQGVALGTTTLTITPGAGFVIEAVLAIFLVIAVLSTAVAGRAGNLAPLAIGMTITLNIMMGGPLTGADFNPAIALGPMVATNNFTDAWLYMIAPLVGAIIAAIIHRAMTVLTEERTTAGRAAAPAE
jgi:glycerol uptake facilitator-like aquaporin